MVGAVYAVVLPKTTWGAVDGALSLGLVGALVVGAFVYFTLGCYYLFRDEHGVGVLLEISVALRFLLCVSYSMILAYCMYFDAGGVDGGMAYVSLFLPAFVFILPSNVFSALELRSILAVHRTRQKQQEKGKQANMEGNVHVSV